MDVIRVHEYDQVHDKIDCDPGISAELREYFTFTIPGAKWMPAVRSGYFDGKIRIFNAYTGLLYTGLRLQLEKFCKDREYKLEYAFDDAYKEFSVKEAEDFIRSLKINPAIQEREYQVVTFAKAVRPGRALILSPTSSGKSFLIYLLFRYYRKRTLIIVPETSLIHQMAREFEEYAGEAQAVHKIFAGQSKFTTSDITITTWQSVVKQPPEWFDQFGLLIGDEAHLFKAKSLVTIMNKATKIRHKFGFTGTLDGTLCNKLVLEGLFGQVIRSITTAELIAQGYAADLNIKCLVLSYPDEVRKRLASYKYQDELDWIVTCDARNRFLKNLALSLRGNTILLFQFVEKHGTILHRMIADEAGEGRRVFYVSGDTDALVRDEIKSIVEKESDAIIVASSVFTTGQNIKNLHNIVFTSPSKARIRVLQSIGRALRTSVTKTKATLYDIADDLKWQNHKNFTLLHFLERVKLYASEHFPYKLYKIDFDPGPVGS